jgi:hypothetical protein
MGVNFYNKEDLIMYLGYHLEKYKYFIGFFALGLLLADFFRSTVSVKNNYISTSEMLIISLIIFVIAIFSLKTIVYLKNGVTPLDIIKRTNKFLFFRTNSTDIRTLSRSIKGLDGKREYTYIVAQYSNREGAEKVKSKGALSVLAYLFFLPIVVSVIYVAFLRSKGLNDAVIPFVFSILLIISILIFFTSNIGSRPNAEERMGIISVLMNDVDISNQISLSEMSLLSKSEQKFLVETALKSVNKIINNETLTKEDRESWEHSREIYTTMLARIKADYPIVDDEEWLSLSKDEQFARVVGK